MTRVKRGNVARKRRKKDPSQRISRITLNPFRTANQQVMKALRSAYRDRKSVSVISAAFDYCINAAARQMVSVIAS